MKKLFVILSIVIVLGLLSAQYFFYKKSPPTETDSKLRIATTIFPIYDIARNIVGDRAVIIPTSRGNTSPHTLVPDTDIKNRLRDTQIIFTTGSDVDSWIRDFVPSASIVPISENIDIIHTTTNGTLDYHYWLSFANAITISQAIADALVELDPKNTDYYRANEAVYIKKLQNAEQESKEKFSTITQKNIVTFHSAWYYFANQYDLRVVNVYQKIPGVEPTKIESNEFLQTIKKYRLKTIFNEPQLSSRSIETFAKKNTLDLVTLDPMEGAEASDESKSYISIMKENVEKIVNALQ